MTPASRLTALLLAVSLSGCPQPAPRVPEPPPEPVGLKHQVMAELEVELRGAASADPADAGAALAAAGAIHAAADWILDDRPESVGAGERTRYEGLVAQLKESARAVQEAAEGGSRTGMLRGYARLQRSCTSCHRLYRPASAAGE